MVLLRKGIGGFLLLLIGVMVLEVLFYFVVMGVWMAVHTYASGRELGGRTSTIVVKTLLCVPVLLYNFYLGRIAYRRLGRHAVTGMIFITVAYFTIVWSQGSGR